MNACFKFPITAASLVPPNDRIRSDITPRRLHPIASATLVGEINTSGWTISSPCSLSTRASIGEEEEEEEELRLVLPPRK